MNSCRQRIEYWNYFRGDVLVRVRILNQDISSVVYLQIITVILIQRNDGYFIPEISILRTFRGENSLFFLYIYFTSLKDK